jgi:hypothetical protein
MKKSNPGFCERCGGRDEKHNLINLPRDTVRLASQGETLNTCEVYRPSTLSFVLVLVKSNRFGRRMNHSSSVTMRSGELRVGFRELLGAETQHCSRLFPLSKR